MHERGHGSTWQEARRPVTRHGGSWCRLLCSRPAGDSGEKQQGGGGATWAAWGARWMLTEAGKPRAAVPSSLGSQGSCAPAFPQGSLLSNTTPSACALARRWTHSCHAHRQAASVHLAQYLFGTAFIWHSIPTCNSWAAVLCTCLHTHSSPQQLVFPPKEHRGITNAASAGEGAVHDQTPSS